MNKLVLIATPIIIGTGGYLVYRYITKKSPFEGSVNELKKK
jgi:hypothetical protein